jgi:hypothetical protein
MILDRAGAAALFEVRANVGDQGRSRRCAVQAYFVVNNNPQIASRPA